MPSAVTSGVMRNERASPTPTQRPIRDALDRDAQERRADHREQRPRDARDHRIRRAAAAPRCRKQPEVRGHHEDLAVREVDELQDAVDHRVAEGHERDHRALRETRDERLDDLHRVRSRAYCAMTCVAYLNFLPLIFTTTIGLFALRSLSIVIVPVAPWKSFVSASALRIASGVDLGRAPDRVEQELRRVVALGAEARGLVLVLRLERREELLRVRPRHVRRVVVREVRALELGARALDEVRGVPPVTADERGARDADLLGLPRDLDHLVVVVRDEDDLGVRGLQLVQVGREVRLALLVALVDRRSRRRAS